MESTSLSLLDRLRKNPTPDDWSRLVRIYEPLIRGWVRRQGIQEHDAADLTQEVLSSIVREMPRFKYDPARGRFCSWLRTITRNRLLAFWKAKPRHVSLTDAGAFESKLIELADANSGLSKQWDQEHDAHLLRQAMTAVRPEFKPATWDAFDHVVIQGKPVETVARELGVTRNVAYIAQSRVLARLREFVRGMCDF